VPTLGQLFGTWEEEQARFDRRNPVLGEPPPLGAPLGASSKVGLAAEAAYRRALLTQQTYDLQNAYRYASVALGQADPYSLEAGAMRRSKLALETALRSRGESLEPERGFDPRDTTVLYDSLGIPRRRRNRRDEEEEDFDAGDLGGGE
jgi:hypothetical protein